MNRLLLLILFSNILFFDGKAQDRSRVDSMYLAKIPFDSIKAKQDLKNDTVRLLNIFSLTWGSMGSRIDETIEPYQLDSIEKSFGFKNEVVALDSILPQHAKMRESEYNRVVVEYLDSIHGIDFWEEYKKQILKTFIKNRDYCGALFADLELSDDTTKKETNFIDDHRRIGYLQNSKHPVEIRYYYTPSLVNGGSVTIIQCIEGEFEAKKVEYWFNPNKTYEKRKINKTKVTPLTPKESWDSIIDSLHSMNFFNFPSMEVIRPRMKKTMKLKDGRIVEKRSMIIDGATYTYQIKIDNKIRTFSYHSPMSWYKVYDNVEELKIADDIRNLFETHLKEDKSR